MVKRKKRKLHGWAKIRVDLWSREEKSCMGENVFGHFSSWYWHSRLSMPQIFGDLPQKCIPFFVSVLAAVIRWVPQHPLTLHPDSKNFSLFDSNNLSFWQQKLQSFYPQWWQFLLLLSASQWTVASKPVTCDELTSQSVVSFVQVAKTLHSLTCHVTDEDKYRPWWRLGKVVKATSPKTLWFITKEGLWQRV